MVLKGRQFVGEAGNRWTVFRQGSSYSVFPKLGPGSKLHEVARSCANVLGVKQTPTGKPIEHVNEHIRIWGAIWERGKEAEIDLEEVKREHPTHFAN